VIWSVRSYVFGSNSEPFIDEGSVIVHVQAEHRKRQFQPNVLDGRCDQRLLAHDHGGGVSPAGSDVRYHQAVRVATAYRLATMRSISISRKEARWRIVPIAERSHGNAFSQRVLLIPDPRRPCLLTSRTGFNSRSIVAGLITKRRRRTSSCSWMC